MTRRRRILIAALAALALVAVLLRFWPAPEAPARTRPGGVSRTAHPERDVKVLGLRLRVIDVAPTGGPLPPTPTPLVLLPGHTSRIEEYEALLPRLARDRRVVVLDFPGSGYSEKPLRRYTLELYEDVVVGLLDALAIPRAHLAGGSQGGHLALRLGARFPARFERLVPWAPGGAWTARPLLAASVDLVASYGFFVPTVRIQSRFWHRPGWPGAKASLEETFRYYDEVMGEGFVAMYWGMAQDQLAHSLFDVAPRVAQPTLLIAGELDTTPGMQEGVCRIRDLAPRCELRVYAGAPHSIAAELPDRLAEDVARFLAEGERP